MSRQWQSRPREEAYAFNPAFLSSIMTEFVREFSRAKHQAAPITFVYLFPALSLHRQSRERFPNRTVTSLYEWIQANEDILVDLPRRIRALLTLTRDGLKFGIYQQVLELDEAKGLITGARKGHFTPSLMDGLTADVNEVILTSRFLARWFAKSGSEASVLSAWGIRP